MKQFDTMELALLAALNQLKATEGYADRDAMRRLATVNLEMLDELRKLPTDVEELRKKIDHIYERLGDRLA